MNDSDIGEDIVPNELPHHIPLVGSMRTDFKPWHRVRKQFIRDQQWNDHIRILVQRKLRREVQGVPSGESENISASSDIGDTAQGDVSPVEQSFQRPLQCFVLPGDELLDMRSLWQALQNVDCSLRFLGFNKTLSTPARRQQMDVAESAITQLPKVNKNSHVSGDTFQDIAKNTTQAYRLFKQYGPYDVVNLDLCDSLVPRDKPGEAEALYSSLHQLIIYQLKCQKTPWLLFATTQVDHSSASQSEINKLAQPFRSNCDQHTSFAEMLSQVIPSKAFTGSDHALDISHLTASHLVQTFGVVLGKWLMQPLAQASPRCTVKLLPSYRYAVKPESGVEMLSLSFLITPHYTFPADTTGMSSLTPPTPSFPNELDSAIDLVKTAINIRDVDILLRSDQVLRERLTNTKADLLSAAGYDRDAYLKWVAEGEQEAST